MAKKGRIYRCSVCGNIIEVLQEGVGTLVCCNQNMEMLEEKEQDQGLEKHVPQIKIDSDIATVTVGNVLHPMGDSHYIQFIQLIVDGNTQTKYLQPNEQPIAEFKLPKEYKNITAREYCNLHGLWRSK